MKKLTIFTQHDPSVGDEFVSTDTAEVDYISYDGGIHIVRDRVIPATDGEEEKLAREELAWYPEQEVIKILIGEK